MKVSELEGAELDYWVALGHGYKAKIVGQRGNPNDEFVMVNNRRPFMPSSDWSDGGPIIENERLDVSAPCENGTFAVEWSANWEWGPPNGYWASKPLVAAMRAYVASKFGDDVDSPQTYQQEK